MSRLPLIDEMATRAVPAPDKSMKSRDSPMTFHFKPSAFNDAQAATANWGMPQETFAGLTATVMRVMGLPAGVSKFEAQVCGSLSTLAIDPATRRIVRLLPEAARPNQAYLQHQQRTRARCRDVPGGIL